MKICLVPAVLVILLGTTAVSAQRVPRRVFVSVTDGSGAPVTNLTAQDFELTENGTRREVARVAVGPPIMMLISDYNSRPETQIERFNTFVDDFIARGGSAHAIVLSDGKNGIISDLAKNLTQNTGGMFDTMNLPNVLPEKMKAIATRVVADQQTMSSRYEVEFRGDGKPGSVAVGVGRQGLNVRLSPRRPF